MNLNMAVEVAGLFADAELLALVRSAGSLGALAVNDAAYRGNVPVWVLLMEGTLTVEEVTPDNTVVPIGPYVTFDASTVVNVSARSWAHMGQPLPSAAVCTISHYNDLAEVRDVISCVDAQTITILDQCSAQQLSMPESFGRGPFRLEQLTFSAHDATGRSPLSTVPAIHRAVRNALSFPSVPVPVRAAMG